ncbi:class I SAM-dependent methyltransferase [Gemmatimonadota bacterium]
MSSRDGWERSQLEDDGFADSGESFTPEAWEPLARAFTAYFRGDSGATLLVHSDVGGPEATPVALFFRSRPGLRDVDRVALDLARGRILDGGAGVGSLALLLQEGGMDVTAAEVIPEAVDIMKARGVRNPHLGSLESLPSHCSFDTILLLMNGSALAGTLGRFPALLRTLESLLRPGGQVLMDSTDLGWEELEGGGEPYLGEVHYQMEFEGVRGAPFPQLFLDAGTLARLVGEEGWEVELVWEGEDGEYLARLTLRGHP